AHCRRAGLPPPAPPTGGEKEGWRSTVSVSPPPKRLVPASGVYDCLAHTEHLGTYPAVVNVGARPTPVIEVHLLDFDGDLRGQVLALDFVARLRDERAFPTTRQIANCGLQIGLAKRVDSASV
ncbi:MAG: riboflavin kinase, partial [Anaerolineae bacterium]|nr:riboflavin kinase [Anaerolineae bacterium]